MKRVIAALTMILIIKLSYGQCTIKEYSAEAEDLRSTEVQYENINIGSQTVLVKLLSISNTTDREARIFFISILTVGSRKGILEPTGLYVGFDDKSCLSLDAYSILKPLTIYTGECIFKISKDQLESLQKKEIKIFNVIDMKTRKIIYCKPIENLLLKQANCISSPI